VEDVVAALAAHGVRARPSTIAPGGVVVEEGAAPGLPDVVPSLAIPQDEASQLVAAALAVAPGERVADLCAGTGVKTTQLLAAAGAPVLAVDLDGRKLRRLVETARAMDLPVPDVLACDILSLPPDLDGTFDAVLLDAPCTGIGTLVRRPEVRYLRKEADFGRAARLQETLLDRAVRLVRPGGRLVFAVCSFAPEEGPGVVAAVMSRRPGLSIEPLVAPPSMVRPDGTLRTLPWRDGVDGFYVARLGVTAGASQGTPPTAPSRP
jgi:16S rRNA (cytosine967-C5)-methyltransferase